jgi:sugar/nucleoside kinase (ribokinase family)
MFDIITIGDATVDNFIIIDEDEAKLQCDLKRENCQLCFNYADKIPIKNTGHSIGGNAANVATGCKKMGLKTSLVAELGDDINGVIIKTEMEKTGVDTSNIKIHKGQDSRYSVVLNYESERTILSHYVSRKYTLPKLPKTKWLYYSSLYGDFTQVQKNIINYLKKNPGTKLAVNPGSHQMKKKLGELKKILKYTDLLFVNKEEAELLVGKKTNIKSLFRALHNTGVKNLTITDGIKGSYTSDGQAMYHMDIYPIKAVGRTGAGDAYASGFMSAMIHKKALKEAMQWGTANAGGVIQIIGAQKGLLTKNGAQKLIKKYPRITPKNL